MNYSRFCLSLLPLCFVAALSAQPEIAWQTCLGGSDEDLPNALFDLPDGSVFLAGVTYSADVNGHHGNADFFAARLDPQGNLLWQRSLGSSEFDYLTDAKLTPDGGFLLAGWASANDGDVSGSHGSQDAWLVKLSAEGNLEWQRSIGGTKKDAANFVLLLPGGGYLCGGRTASPDGDIAGFQGVEDCWLAQLDEAGNLLWLRTYGGAAEDAFLCGATCPDGGFLLGGYTSSVEGDVTLQHGEFDIWLVKTDADGNLLWQKTLGGSVNEGITGMAALADGCFIAGYTNSADGDVTQQRGATDAWMLRLDAGGNLLWQKTLGSEGADAVRSFVQTPDGGFLVSGNTGEGGSDFPQRFGKSDYWAAKLSGSGELVWASAFGGTDDDLGFALAHSAEGFAMTGMSKSNDGQVSGNHGSGDIWLIFFDEYGNLRWQQSFGGSGIEPYGNNVLLPASDGGYLLANSSASNDGNVSGQHGSKDIWLLKLKPFATPPLDTPECSLDLKIFPNPTSGKVTVAGTRSSFFSEMSLFDAAGRLVWKGGELRSPAPLDWTGLPQGVYFLVAHCPEGMRAKKIVINSKL